MKKIAFLAVIALLFVACSKEQRQNRKIDGDWNLETYDGKGLESGETETMSFEKDKKGEGSGTYTSTYNSESYSVKFTYKIIDDKLTISITEDGVSYGTIFTIKELKNKEMTLAEPDGSLSVYKQ